MSHRQWWLMAIGGVGILAIISLFLRPLIAVDETRYITVAWEMWDRGQFLVRQPLGRHRPVGRAQEVFAPALAQRGIGHRARIPARLGGGDLRERRGAAQLEMLGRGKVGGGQRRGGGRGQQGGRKQQGGEGDEGRCSAGHLRLITGA